MAEIFQPTVINTPAGFVGQCAGIRKPGTSKGYIITDPASQSGLGVTVGNFCYHVADSYNSCVGANASATSAVLTGGTADTAANIVGYTNPTFNIYLNGTPYQVTPTFTTGMTYAQIAAAVQTALRAAIVSTGNTTATVTFNASNKFVLDTVVTGGQTLSFGDATQLATGLGFTAQSGATITQGTSGLSLAGIVTRSGSYVGVDLGTLIYNTGFSNVVPAGQVADVAFRGSWFVSPAVTLVAGTVPQFSTIYSRDSDGAIALGSLSSGTFTGYTKTNFITFSVSADNVVGGLIIIGNDERVGV